MGRFAWKPVSVVTLTAAIAVVLFASTGAPVVDAGGSVIVNTGTLHTLAASCSDDGLPPGTATLGCTLAQTTGTGCVLEDDAFTCVNQASPDLDVTCSTSGENTITLCCDDDGVGSNVAVCDNMTITANDAPSANAGADIADAVINVSEAIVCTPTDDGIPAAATCAWTNTSGVAATFGNASACSTTATWASAGSSVITCTVSDSVRSSTPDSLTATISEPESEECADPLPNYAYACETDLRAHVQTTVTAASATGYDGLDAVILPEHVDPPAMTNGACSAATEAQLENCCNGTGGQLSARDITVTADIASAVECYGDDNRITLQSGVLINKIIICTLSGRADRLEIVGPGAIGMIECGQSTYSHVKLRGVTIAPDLVTGESDVGSAISFSTDGGPLEIVNSVIRGRDCGSETDSAEGGAAITLLSDNVTIANSHLASGVCGADDSQWPLRADGDQYLIVDSAFWSHDHRAIRFGHATTHVLMTTTDAHESDARRQSFVLPYQCYPPADLNDGDVSDGYIFTRADILCGTATSSNFTFGGNTAAGLQSTLWLAGDLHFTSTGNYATAATVTTLQGLADTGEYWRYNVGSTNSHTSGTIALDTFVWPDICDYLDDGDTVCPPESDPHALLPINRSPTADAGADDNVEEDTPYALTCTCDDSVDTIADTPTCAWTESGDGTCVFDDDTDCTTNIECDTAGSTAVTCACNDGKLTGSSNSMTLTIDSAATPLMLDNVDQTVLATFGMHRNVTAFTSALIRIRDLTADTETDLAGSSAAAVTESAIETYCNGHPCTIVTWYDQSGNGNDVTASATESDQPPITDGSGNAYLCGSGNVPCMYFAASDFQDCEVLQRTDALGLSGNPGVVAYFMWDEETTGSHDDGFIWSIGGGVGAQYGDMPNWQGATHLISFSTMMANEAFLNPSDETFGYYESMMPSGQSITNHTIRRNTTSLTSNSVSDGTPTLTDDRLVIGGSARSDFWFCPHGYLSEITFMSTFDSDDRTDIEAAQAARD